MSTRANIIIKDGNEKLYFYRHSDGYPEVTEKSLNVLLSWLQQGRIRDNIQQFSGWLIKLGAAEYKVPNEPLKENDGMSWKCGAYEPTTGIHLDVEYVYTIILPKGELIVQNAEHNNEFKAEVRKYNKK